MLDVAKLKETIRTAVKLNERHILQVAKDNQMRFVPVVVADINEVAYVHIVRGKLSEAILSYPMVEGGKDTRIVVELVQWPFYSSYADPLPQRVRGKNAKQYYRQQSFTFYPNDSGAINFTSILN